MNISEKFLKNREYAKIYNQQDLIMRITEKILEWMEVQNVSMYNLAEKMGESNEFISKLFSGEAPISLEILADIGFALGFKFEFTIGEANE